MVKRFAFIAITVLAFQAAAEERSVFRDPEDGGLDASEWLLEKKGFLPVPILITEPAIGYGGGVAMLWFRESIGERRAQGRLTPPDIFGAALAATENGTTLVGGIGMVTFAEEKWRWRGFIGRPDVNLDFYGGPNDELKIGYNLQGWATTHLLQRRLGESDNFVGARWNYIDFDVRFDPSRPDSELPTIERNVRSSGLGLFFEHDSRDNFFTPSGGWKLFLESVFYAEELGSSGDYQLYRAYGLAYFPFRKNFILGTRVDARAARGEVPFYQLPFIEMRGIPFFRYQDENVALAEAELRWNVTPRWSLVGFFGSGRTWGTGGTIGDGETASAWGVGFRRLMARRLGIYMGVDLARGPEETAIYIQAGSAWR